MPPAAQMLELGAQETPHIEPLQAQIELFNAVGAMISSQFYTRDGLTPWTIGLLFGIGIAIGIEDLCCPD